MLAQQGALFTPSKFDKYWLNSNGIISGEKIHDISIFSPEVVQVITDDLALIIMKEQIQIASRSRKFKEVMSQMVVSFVNHMEVIQLQGLGINFNWFIKETEESYGVISKNLFYNQNDPASKYFANSDSMYGSYYSQDISEHVRLKLDIKPASVYDAVEKSTSDCIHFAFNFHANLKGDNQKEIILSIINDFEKFEIISKEIMDLY